MPFQLLLSLVTKSAAWFSVGKLCVDCGQDVSRFCVTLLFPFPIFTSHYIRNECTRSTRKEDSIAREPGCLATPVTEAYAGGDLWGSIE